MNLSTLALERRQFTHISGVSKMQMVKPSDLETSAASEWSEHFSRLFGQSPVSIFVTDKTGRIEHVNRTFTRLTGYSADEAIGQNPRLLKSGKTSPEIYRKLWAQILAGREWRGNLLNRRKNGEVFWESVAISPIYDKAGDITHFLSIGEDISERMELEHQLAETLDFNWKIISEAPVGILVFKHSGECVLANETATRMVKGTIAQILQQNFRQLESWRASGLLAAAENALTTQTPQFGEFHLITSFGKEIWIEARFSCFIRDNERHLLLTINDITERHHSEEKNRLQAILLNEAADAIWGLDLNERINYWNNGAERLYGWTAAEVIGKSPMDLLYRGIMTSQLQECIRVVKQHGSWAGELEEFTKDGKTVIVHSRCNAVHGKEGTLKSLLVINTDITEKKRMETQLLRSQRMESLGTLAGGIAHDLNNILAPLLIAVQLLREKVSNDEDGQKLLQTLESNVERGASLIRQVLAFGRGARGERVPVQLSHLLHEIEQMIRETFPKSVVFEPSIEKELWSVTGDATQLHQVLLNLCVNARDAMPDGGQLELRVKNVLLDKDAAESIYDARPGSYLMVQVADTGMGIPKDVQDRMFEPFFTTKAPGKGTGLGLSTCIGIVKGHGGFIHCNSSVGKGSVFSVYLPATVNTAQTFSVTAQNDPVNGQNELILVVDDEKVLREVAQSILEKFNYRVAIATNGAEAVEIYRQRQSEIAAVIIDIAMPVMDGNAAIETLKTMNPSVKIVRASGLDAREIKNENFKSDTQYFISKPYSANTLLQTLQKALADGSANFTI